MNYHKRGKTEHSAADDLRGERSFTLEKGYTGNPGKNRYTYRISTVSSSSRIDRVYIKTAQRLVPCSCYEFKKESASTCGYISSGSINGL
jgi:hypothetical protein